LSHPLLRIEMLLKSSVRRPIGLGGEFTGPRNRYAFVYSLREICRVDAYLANVYFLMIRISPITRQDGKTG